MQTFLPFLFDFLTVFFGNLWQGIVNLVSIFNIPAYINAFKAHYQSFSVLDWILSVLSVIVVLALLAGLIWLIYLPIFALLAYNISMLHSGQWLEATWLQIPLFLIGAAVLSSCNWALILQSYYENKPMATVRNSVVFGFAYFFASITNVAAMAVPVLLLYISLYTVPVVGLFCFSGVGMLQATVYTRIFDKLEEEQAQAKEADQEAIESEE